ncbi:hypothetical protein QQ045_022486 [Rhodiola kirilowii]
MAAKLHFSLLYLSSFVILFSCVIQQSAAFTIKLIHRYAPDSPFYNPNLTDQEIVERLNFQLRTRKMENATLLDLQAIRPRLSFDDTISAYLVKVSLGTIFGIRGPSHKSYYLSLDTGSSITWLQCEDCKKSRHHCYRQYEPPFPNSKSSSYQPLPYGGGHPLCFPNKCIGDSCSYHVIYADDSYSIGILARERFAFPSSTGQEETISFVFGCGIDNHNPDGERQTLLMAGIFGLGWGPHSFVAQTNSISHGRFSYCLPPGIQAARGSPVFMRFGSDIPSYSTLPGTRLIQYQGDNSYYVNLLDIAINGGRLNIPSSYFQKGRHDGGSIFDSGCAMTRISSPAYRMVKQAVETHIARYVRSLTIVGPMFGFDLCYQASKPFRGQSNLPSITFYFEGNAHLVVKPDTSFYVNSHDGEGSRYAHICLSMIPSDAQRMTVIGSDLQANQFIVYDVTGQRMYFGPRDCSHDH